MGGKPLTSPQVDLPNQREGRPEADVASRSARSRRSGIPVRRMYARNADLSLGTGFQWPARNLGPFATEGMEA